MNTTIEKATEVKVKMYGSWTVWKNKKEAIFDLLEYCEGSEGAERSRYMEALFEIKNGRTIIDTDL